MEKNEIQEVQGLYGSFSLAERVVQKIWLKGDFDQVDLKTASGKALRIIDPGRWNLLEGPDFVEARLLLNGEERVGDVEVHFSAGDWFTHGHERDRNFSRVLLHVVLWPDTREAGVTTAKGTRPETIYLMPLLQRDLEDYAIENALMELEQIEDAQWMLKLLEVAEAQRLELLREAARQRWSVKVGFARKRLETSGWRSACHQYCLEVLGYARNRAPMGRLALTYDIAEFASRAAAPDALFEEVGRGWRLSGIRPANHPRQRLRQYAAICAAEPDWPDRLTAVLDDFPEVIGDFQGADFRRAYGLNQFLKRIGSEVFSGQISIRRLNTLICDALLPMAEARGSASYQAYWREWPAGDAPVAIPRFLKQAGVITRAEPFSNGQLQGTLQRMLTGR